MRDPTRPVAERRRRALGVARFERQAVDDGYGPDARLPPRPDARPALGRSPSDSAVLGVARVERQAVRRRVRPAARPAASDRMRDPALSQVAEQLRRALGVARVEKQPVAHRPGAGDVRPERTELTQACA
jgi:hypothetical protein